MGMNISFCRVNKEAVKDIILEQQQAGEKLFVVVDGVELELPVVRTLDIEYYNHIDKHSEEVEDIKNNYFAKRILEQAFGSFDQADDYILDKLRCEYLISNIDSVLNKPVASLSDDDKYDLDDLVQLKNAVMKLWAETDHQKEFATIYWT